jgi:predicted nucleic acid-binding protein
VSPDPDDNKFLECAQAAGADYLVTGNKRHFPKRWGKTKVVNARELLDLISPELEQ